MLHRKHLYRLTVLAAVVSLLSICPSAPAAITQDQSPSQGQTSEKKADDGQPQTTAPPERKKAKKVWTNENMGEVSSSPISEIGRSGSANPASPAPQTKSVSPQTVAPFRKQLATLQAQQAAVEKQIEDLKNFSRGEPSHDSGLQLYKRYNPEPVDVQIRKLEDKHKQIAAQIDALYDAARKKGIEPGQLR